MRRLAPVLAAFAVVAAAATAAGCGNAAQNDYVDQVNQLQRDLVTKVTDATAGASIGNAKDAAKVADRLEAAFTSTADDLEAVAPPGDVADLHAQLVDKVRSLGDQIAKAAKAFRGGDAQQAVEAAQQLQSTAAQAQTELNSIIDQINAKL